MPWASALFGCVTESEWAMRCDDTVNRFLRQPELELQPDRFLFYCGLSIDDASLETFAKGRRWLGIKTAIESARANAKAFDVAAVADSATGISIRFVRQFAENSKLIDAMYGDGPEPFVNDPRPRARKAPRAPKTPKVVPLVLGAKRAYFAD